MRWATQRIGIRPFALLFVGLAPLCAGMGACSSSPSVGNADTGSMSTPTPDTGMTTQFDATTIGPPDVASIFPGGDTGTDATVSTDAPGKDGGVDATTQHDGGSSPDGGVDSTVPPGTDSGSKDSGTPPKDTGPVKDTGTPSCTTVTVPTDTNGAIGCAAPVSGMCGPGSLTNFAATAPPPTGAHQNKCTAQQITDTYNGCLGGGSGTCPPASDPSGDCHDCIFTDQTAAKWGPLVSSAGGLASINYGGCLALLEPCNQLCANAFEDDLQCEAFSCGTNCPVTSQAQVTAYESCATTIDSCDPNGCYVYSNGSETCGAEITGAAHPGAACFANANSFLGSYTAVATVFCGP